MTIEIETADRDRTDEWEEYVRQSSDANPFHHAPALDVQATYSNTEVHPLVGFKGQEPVGLFPVFTRTTGPFTAAFSPPPPLWVPRLGPVLLNMEGLKRRKAERRTRKFIEGCFAWLAEHPDVDLFRATSVGGYRDLRPFKWNGANVTPEYTYVVDLTRDREDLLAQFSSDARRNVTNTDADYSISVGAVDDARRIIDDVRARYRDQGKSFAFPDGFVPALKERLPRGTVRPYVCRSDGAYLGGILTVEDDSRIYRWHGGVKPGGDVDLPVNDLLDWYVMTDAMDRGLTEYDLVGADDRRIASYKSKFAPTLEVFYGIESGSWVVRTLANLTQRLRYRGRT